MWWWDKFRISLNFLTLKLTISQKLYGMLSLDLQLGYKIWISVKLSAGQNRLLQMIQSIQIIQLQVWDIMELLIK